MMQTETRPREMMKEAEMMPANAYVGAVLASIVVSAVLFVMGKKELGLFVGLWPPTILNLALVMKQLRPSKDIEGASSGGMF